MTQRNLNEALEEIEDASNKLDLRGIKQFTTLMAAEGLTHRGEYKTAGFRDLQRCHVDLSVRA